MELATIAATIAQWIANGFSGKIGEDLWTKLLDIIRKKFQEVKRIEVLTDLEEEKTEENSSEFKAALEKQMKKDEDFKKEIKELVEQIELARKNHNLTSGNTMTGANLTDVKTTAGNNAHITIGNTTQTN